MNADIVPIIVTYNPEKDTLLTSLIELLAQVETVIVVDNGSDAGTELILQNLSGSHRYNVKLIALEQNFGLGKAYNAGITLARNLKADFVLLMDQDSVPESNMLTELRSAFISLEAQGNQLLQWAHVIASIRPTGYPNL